MKLTGKKKKTPLRRCLARIPWELIPFVLSMFVLVLTLDGAGVTAKAAELLGEKNTIPGYAFSSF